MTFEAGLYKNDFIFMVVLASAEYAPAQAHVPQPTVIHVEVVGLHSGKGRVVCALYSFRDGFPKQSEKALAHISSEMVHKQAVCDFSGVAPGTYAVSVFHDENSNGKLEANFMGIPREGVGASNNAKGISGRQNSRRPLFLLSGGRLELKSTVNYL